MPEQKSMAPTEPQTPLTMSVPEAGKLLKLGRDASYQAARRGQIPVLEFGRLLRVPVALFNQMLGL